MDENPTADTLLLLNEAISLGRRDGMAGQHLDAMCSARDEIERLHDALCEVTRNIDMAPELKARNAAVFTAWDIATRALAGESYPWGYTPWRENISECQ